MGTPVPHAPALTHDIIEGCDIVYVGVTPSAHKDLVIRALSAGKHVLLEKPLASTPEDADAIVVAAEAAEAGGTWLGMNIGMRWNEALLEMRRRVHREMDDPRGMLHSASLSLHFCRWPREWQQVSWVSSRADGGPLRECGTHYLAALHELFGRGCVRRVRATVSYGDDGPDGTYCETAIEGELELIGGLQVALSVRTDGTGLAADGSDHYELELRLRQGGVLQLHDFVCLRCKPAEDSRRWKPLVSDGEYGRTECVTTLCAAIRGDSTAERVTARDGREVQRVLDALLDSRGDWVEVNKPQA